MNPGETESGRAPRFVAGGDKGNPATGKNSVNDQRPRIMDDSAPVMLFISGPDRCCTWFNRQWLNFVGRTLEQEIELGWTANVHPDDLERCRETFQRAFDARRDVSLEYRLRRCDGDYRWVLNNSVPLYDTEGAFTGYISACVDSTIHRQHEQSVRESQAHLQLTTEAARMGTWQWDLASGKVIWSPMHRELWGYPPSDQPVTTDDWSARVHPDDLELARESTQRCLQGVPQYEAEYRILPVGSSEVRWIRSIGKTNFDDAGRPVSMYGVSFDVTDRRLAEESSRQNEELLRLAQRTAMAGVWEFEIADGTAWWSDECFRLYGVSRETYVPSVHNWLQLVLPKDRQPAADALQRAIDERTEFSFEFRILHPEKGERWLWEVGQAEPDASGEPRRMAGITLDVTERKRAERDIRDSEARFRNMADHAPVMVWVAEADGTCSFLSQSWYEFTGQTPATGLGFGWLRVVHPEDRGQAEQAFRDAVARRQAFRFDYRLRRQDGVYRWAIDSAAPRFASNGEFLGYIGSVIDITERKVAEEALKAADRRKDEFLATLAHELRNPLAPIRTGLELMRMIKDDAEALEDVRQTMERQTLQMVRLIDDLLDVSRITRGKLELRKARMLLREAVQSAVEAARPFVEAQRHELTVSMPERRVFVDADPHRLAQILANLLNNAAKYTPEGGRIWLIVEPEDDAVTIRVRDTGLGIPVEQRDQIFEMFAQIDRSIERGFAGLGIGLTLVKSLVEMHGGTVEVSSEGANRGSEFRVRLPADVGPAETTPDAEKSSLPRCGAARRVLVVDDNRDAADSLALMLRLLGNQVRTAYDGLEALEVGAEFHPDAVLLDLGMPRLNGYETARRLRQSAWGAPTLLIAMTGWGQDEDKRQTRAAGFDHHLVKPAEPAEVQRLLAAGSESTAPS